MHVSAGVLRARVTPWCWSYKWLEAVQSGRWLRTHSSLRAVSTLTAKSSLQPPQLESNTNCLHSFL